MKKQETKGFRLEYEMKNKCKESIRYIYRIGLNVLYRYLI